MERMEKMKILLVEPDFPVTPKSKNHKDFLPIGLLKLGSMLRATGNDVKLIRGNLTKKEILKSGDDRWNEPNEIMITSLFTYWKKYVVDSVVHYRRLFPFAKITVGGIYASLMPDDCKKIPGVDEVWSGIYPEAEKYSPAYELITQNSHQLDYQIIHSSRGCPRRCSFCGTWKIEPKFEAKESIKDEIKYKKIVFYDNNLLLNPHIEKILYELIELKKKKQILWCESQSGFDGRVLERKPHLGKLIKEAGFRNPRIAWDHEYNQYNNIKNQINILIDAGYKSKDIFVFMLYNHDLSFEEMEKKRIKCWEWKVQISDCRYRPLDQTFDNYEPRKNKQTKKDYYIHKGWTDKLIRQFRKNVRRQNICVRQNVTYYSGTLEQKRIPKDEFIKYKKMRFEEAKKYLNDSWNPSELHHPNV